MSKKWPSRLVLTATLSLTALACREEIPRPPADDPGGLGPIDVEVPPNEMGKPVQTGADAGVAAPRDGRDAQTPGLPDAAPRLDAEATLPRDAGSRTDAPGPTDAAASPVITPPPPDGPPPGPPLADLASGLTGFWPFSEAAGSAAADSQGSGRPAELSGGTLWTKDVPPGVRYPNAAALSFDGADDLATIRDRAIGISKSYTISLWVRPAATRAVNIAVRTNEAGPLMRWGEQARITSEARFEHHNTRMRNVAGTTNVAENRWYHVAITAVEGGLMRLYVNGAEEGTAVETPPLEPTDRLLLGSASGNGMAPYRGLVDELATWDRALSSAQIKALAGGQQPGTRP